MAKACLSIKKWNRKLTCQVQLCDTCVTLLLENWSDILCWYFTVLRKFNLMEHNQLLKWMKVLLNIIIEFLFCNFERVKGMGAKEADLNDFWPALTLINFLMVIFTFVANNFIYFYLNFMLLRSLLKQWYSSQRSSYYEHPRLYLKLKKMYQCKTSLSKNIAFNRMKINKTQKPFLHHCSFKHKQEKKNPFTK